MTNTQDSLRFHHKTNTHIKSVQTFPNGLHRLFDDTEADDVRKCVIEWCSERLRKPKGFLKPKQVNFGVPAMNRHKNALMFAMAMVFLYFFKM